MKCLRAQEMFSSYLEDTIESPLRVAFEQHLAECPLCQEKYKKVNAAVMMLEELPEVVTPTGFHATIMARVEQARRAKPDRVKWWSIDWERVFTVRVPAKAAAMGLAVLLVAALVVPLTPLNTITANLLWPQKATNAPASVDNGGAPSYAWGPWGSSRPAQIKDSGLSISVMVSQSDNAQNGYRLRLETGSQKSIDFTTSLLPATASSYASAGTLIRSGSVAKGDSVVMPVTVGQKGAIIKLAWKYQNRDFSDIVFLPSSFDLMAWNKEATVLFKNETSFNMLKDVSSEYGIVLLASGDLSKKADDIRIISSSPDDAISSVTSETGLMYRALAPSIYLIEPRL